jgi:curved DNA-binding protein
LRVPYRDSAGRSRWRQKRLKIDIPAGVHEGKIIRLAGQGSPGTNGKGGDLLLEVRFRPHPKLRAVKRDIHMVLPLAPWEAALGAVVPVDLPTGTVKVRIPRGVQQGRHLHVPERGIPGKPPGDLILEANIVLPPADTPSAERAYQTFARETAFAPRQ